MKLFLKEIWFLFCKFTHKILNKSRNDILEPNKTNFTYEKCKSQKEIRIPSRLGKTKKNEKCKELFNNKYEYLL